MASSSAFVPPKQPLPYAVFLSFRGEDTRNNFVSHLYSALNDRGIRTYFDGTNLQKGETIAIELVKAIEESSIAIVVLSSNYGSSTWCLNELVRIIECKNKSGLIVFPIFYDIDPSEVRRQKNSFFEAFSIHEVNFKDNGQMVKIWREALTSVADLAGEDIRGKNEASCIKKIVDKILWKLPMKASQFRKSLVGIDSRISEIQKLIYDNPNEVLFVGLWGMGGIGKTTTARAVFEECKNKFEGSCFLQDVRQGHNRMENLQKKLLSNVLKTETKGIYDVIEGSIMIQERLQFKKVLIVIDDVDDIEQLNVLAKQCDWFGRGSRIIITTRDEHLLNDVHIEKYDVQTLPKNDALHLFSLHAFKNDHPPEDYKELSLEVLRYAGGLPLALQVLGHHLYRREKYAWTSTLRRLKDVPEDKIISKLQISFDGLNVLQQNIFLNIACFFRGYSKRSVEERLQSLCLHPKEGIDVLIQRSLIYLWIVNYEYISDIDSDSDDDGDGDQCRYQIEMHDLLQEMGWFIVRQRSNWDVRRYSHLWLEKDIVAVLSDIKVSSEAEGICMGIDYDDAIKFKLGWEGAFKNMNKLCFLELSGDVFEINYDVNVSESNGQLDNKLRWFSLSHYPGHSLPKSFCPVNLVHLDMKFSLIKETPDFSLMPNLQVLNLRGSEMLVHVHPSLGDHVKIKRINLAYCQKLEEFPEINTMNSLEILDLSYSSLQNFPEMYGNLDSLRKLKLRGTPINGLPTSIEGNATGLQSMLLECHRPYKEEFISLEVVANSFPGLITLGITGSGIVRTVNFSYLPYLEKLDLSDSEELIQVHASLGFHKRIKSINLANCSKLEVFPRIVDMNSLEELDLSCTAIQSFPEMTGNVNRLVKLHLDATLITTLPWSIGHASGLEIISIKGCEYLVTLPISFLGLQFLRIYIGSGALKYFKENIDDEAAVEQEVELHSRQKKRGKHSEQMTVSGGTGKLSGVQIYFRYCECLEELPEPLLSRVEVLVITECPTLTSWICFNLVDLLDKYQHLCYLQLHQEYDIVPHEFLQAFSEQESMCNMMRKRKKSFEVCVPGRQIPSWFQYQISRRSVSVFLPPFFEWYTDKLRGFVVCGINANLTDKSVLSTSDNFDQNDDCCCRPQLHVVVMYIPIDTIRGDRREWNGQKEYTLFELTSERNLGIGKVETSTFPRWGLSLVYSEGEAHEVDPHQVIIVADDCVDWSPCATFRVKIARSRDMREVAELSQARISATAHDLLAPHVLPLFPSGPDLTCYQEGEPSSTYATAKMQDASELGLQLSLN